MYINKEIVTSLYDKRDDFSFTIGNFPDSSGNIPQDGSYGVFIAQSLRYANACVHYDDFIACTKKLKCQLVQQHFDHHTLIRKLNTWMRRSPKSITMMKYGFDKQRIASDLN